MKEGWGMKKLGDVCEVIAGQSPKSQFYNEDEVGLPFYQGKKEFQEKYIGEPRKWTSKVTKEALEDDILMSVRAPVGPVNFSTQKCCIGRGLAAIRSSELIDKDYCFYYLQSKEDELIGNSGAVFNSINKTQIGNISIPIPPLSEQKQIVAILDKAFAAIDQAQANIKKNIANAKELFQSKLNAIFLQKGEGWEEKTFQELSSRIGDGLHGTPNYDEKGEYYFINGNNLNDGIIELKDNTKRVNKEEFEKNKRDLTLNTVLISINGTLGKVAFYNGEPVILGKSACYINFNKEVNKYYIKYLVKSSLFFDNMGKQSTGATIKNFSLKSMRNYKLLLPSINEQEEIVEDLKLFENEIIQIESHYHQKLTNLEDLKKSLLQKAFSGELTMENEQLIMENG